MKPCSAIASRFLPCLCNHGTTVCICLGTNLCLIRQQPACNSQPSPWGPALPLTPALPPCSPLQIPFDATVRVSLDTNLCMIKENPEDGPTCAATGRWYRDPSLAIHRTEITRFPHAVLEVKLSLPEGMTSPPWVQVRMACVQPVCCVNALSQAGA